MPLVSAPLTGVASLIAYYSCQVAPPVDVLEKDTSFFKKSFWRTDTSFWGPSTPEFGFLVTSPLGFKARVGSALICFLRRQM